MTRLAMSPAEQREMADSIELEDTEIPPNNRRQARKHGAVIHVDLDPLNLDAKQFNIALIYLTDGLFYPQAT